MKYSKFCELMKTIALGILDQIWELLEQFNKTYLQKQSE